jgi:hypothetical protein
MKSEVSAMTTTLQRRALAVALIPTRWLPDAVRLCEFAALIGSALPSPAATTERATISLLDALTPAQRSDARAGTFRISSRDQVQECLDFLEKQGGGVLGWTDVMVDGPLFVRGSNITIQPKNGNRLILTGNSRHAIRVLPRSLEPLLVRDGRPRLYPDGIQGEGYETLMYEGSDAHRSRNVHISGLKYANLGSGEGRFLDAYSVDDLYVTNNDVQTRGNGINAWYCRRALSSGNVVVLDPPHRVFPIFYFKSFGDVTQNELRNGAANFEGKGCYPQSGAQLFDKFDSSYSFDHPIRFFGNRSLNFKYSGAQSGYRDNKAEDICLTPQGISKREWFGKTANVQYFENYFESVAGVLSPDSGAVVVNVNSINHSAKKNTCVGAGFVSLAATDFLVAQNAIARQAAPATAAITFRGGTFGGVKSNSLRCLAVENQIRDQQNPNPAIYLSGASQCEVMRNVITSAPKGAPAIRVDSRTAVLKSTENRVHHNVIEKLGADFDFPILCADADRTIVEFNQARGGWYSGNATDAVTGDVLYRRAVVSAPTRSSRTGVKGSNMVRENTGDLS